MSKKRKVKTIILPQNASGKFEFSKEELEELLDATRAEEYNNGYRAGYKDGYDKKLADEGFTQRLREVEGKCKLRR